MALHFYFELPHPFHKTLLTFSERVNTILCVIICWEQSLYFLKQVGPCLHSAALYQFIFDDDLTLFVIIDRKSPLCQVSPTPQQNAVMTVIYAHGKNNVRASLLHSPPGGSVPPARRHWKRFFLIIWFKNKEKHAVDCPSMVPVLLEVYL